MAGRHYSTNLLALLLEDKMLDRYTKMSSSFSRVIRNDPCVYCAEQQGITKDHIVPQSKGGLRELDNIAPACEWCNVRKGDMSLLEFLLWRNFPMNRELKLEHKPTGIVIYVPPNTHLDDFSDAMDDLAEEFEDAFFSSHGAD